MNLVCECCNAVITVIHGITHMVQWCGRCKAVRNFVCGVGLALTPIVSNCHVGEDGPFEDKLPKAGEVRTVNTTSLMSGGQGGYGLPGTFGRV